MIFFCYADTFIQKTKRLYMDTRTQRNLTKLNDDLAEVHSIMTRNIAEVLGQGEKLDSECWPPRRAPNLSFHLSPGTTMQRLPVAWAAAHT